jgi:hypothetical protein
LPIPPYPSVPAPSTWSSGPILTSELSGDVTNAVNFLANRPLFVGQNNQGASIASGSDVTVGMNVEIVDTWSGHNTTSTNWQTYFCQAPGWYLCEGYIPFAYTTATQAVFAAGFSATTGGTVEPVVRGQLQLVGSGKHPGTKVADLIRMSVTGPVGGTGDSVALTALQVTGSSVAYTSSPATLLPFVSVRWVAATSGTTGLPVPSNPAWPTPPSYVTSAELNAGIRDTIRFLTYPPVCKAYYVPGSASIPNQTFPSGTVVNLNTVPVDNYSGFTTGSAGGYTAPVAGVYYLYGQINYAADSTATGVAYSAGLRVNSGTIQWGDSVFKDAAESSGGGAIVRKRLRLNSGDFVQFCAQQSSGGTLGLNGTTANQTRFIAIWESA